MNTLFVLLQCACVAGDLLGISAFALLHRAYVGFMLQSFVQQNVEIARVARKLHSFCPNFEIQREEENLPPQSSPLASLQGQMHVSQCLLECVSAQRVEILVTS